MQSRGLRIGTYLLVLCGVLFFMALEARASDGPLGLRWAMPTEEVEKLGIDLCCRQVGKWGARYEVKRQDFNKFPNSLGDEDKVYLYFGNSNKLLRVYIAIRKEDGWNRYKQISNIVGNKYNFIDSCTRRKYTKYEALEKGKREETCKDYQGYSTFQKNDIDGFVGLEKYQTDYQISTIFLHKKLYERDRKKNSPL